MGSNSSTFGFNGKEMDNDMGSGTGNIYDYGFRIYNPQIAKFLSVDPLTKSYPWYTPYQFAGNTPIQAIDLDGLEPVKYDMEPTVVGGKLWTSEMVYEAMQAEYELIMNSFYIKKIYTGEHVIDHGGIKRAGERILKETGDAKAALAFKKQAFQEAQTALYSPDWDGQYFNKQMSNKLRDLESKSRQRKEAEAADIRAQHRAAFLEMQKITFGDYIELAASSAALTASCLSAGAGIGIVFVPATYDSWVEDVRIMQDKKYNLYDPNKKYSLGGEIEQEYFGTNHYDTWVNPLMSAGSVTNSSYFFIKNKDKIDLMDALINSGLTIKSTVNNGNKE